MEENCSGFRIPTRFVRVGEEISRYGVRLKCIKRPDARTLVPADACKGCWFAKGYRMLKGRRIFVTCHDIQCSRFDRMDAKSVWFIDITDEG